MDRRALLSGKFTEGKLNLSNSRHSVYAYAKLLGSADDAMVHFSLEGTIFALLPNGAKPFIGFQTMLKGVWEKQGQDSFQYRLYETGFFHHLDSKDHIEIFENPITNQTNQLSVIKGGPYETLIKPSQLDWVVSGDDVWIQEPQSRMGYFGSLETSNNNKQTAFANTIFRGKLSQLNDESSIASSMMTYNYISPWYPFFEMDDVDGKMYWQAVGTKTQSWSDVPTSMQDYLTKNQRNYFESTHPWTERTSTLKHFRQSSKRDKKRP
jgi:hypothetical protein|tara:strand:+ start:1569 stop:2366 length:798 start_codon:yes stop_codon:yes gene_type:complete